MKFLKRIFLILWNYFIGERSMTRNEKISEIAAQLNFDPAWLDGLINFETGGTYDPLAANPKSSARGLIQITDSTARSMFGLSSEDLVRTWPDFNGQMDNVVYPYLARYAPFPSRQSLYMSVFYPAYRDVAPNTPFPDTVRQVNPGINTPADYMSLADRRVAASSLAGKAGISAVIVIAGLIAWYFIRGGKI